jgi:hypothetical protein
MTTAQKAALQALVGRALTAEEESQIDGHLPARRDDLVAQLLSVGRTQVRSRMTSARGLAEFYPGGPLGAEVVLQKLEGAAASLKVSVSAQDKLLGSLISRQLSFLAGDGLDFGSAALRGMLDQFVTLGILTAEEVVGLKAIAVYPNPLPTNAVSDALNAAEV